MKKPLILVIFLVLFIGVAGLVYYGQWKEKTSELYYSGTLEATESNLAFQVNGRVSRVLVDDGWKVKKGQLLAELDRKEFLTREAQARADLDRAQENLSRSEALLALYKQTLPEEVTRADASVSALKSNLRELKSGYRVQEVEQARRVLETARLTMENAKRNKIRFDKLYEGKGVSEKERDAVRLQYETAFEHYRKAQEAFSLLKEGYRSESIEAAKAKVAEGQAVLREAKSNLKRIDITDIEAEAARAQMEGAVAGLKLAKIQLNHTQLRAPFEGVITSRNVEPGEVVSPGREVLSLADLSTVKLKIFVGETEIGKVKPGQKVTVKIDTFPHKTFTGHVSYISPQAEFTPKIVQTHKERVKLVYLVKIIIPNPDLELKSGMPADAWFE